MSRLDTIDPVVLGERLRIARSSSEMTQEDVADKIGMARTTLVAIERGQRKARAEELMRLSQLYDVESNYLLGAEAIHVDMAARFRLAPLQSRERNITSSAVKLLNKLAASAVEIERLLGKQTQYNYPPEQPILPGDIQSQAEHAALFFRHYLGIGLAPIGDLIALAEMRLGVRIFIRPLDSKISGLYAYDPDVGACILINQKHPLGRQYISLAHELGHFICRRSMANVSFIDHNEDAREERFATLFSLALMMPPPAIRSQFQEICDTQKTFSPRHLITLARLFNVSTEAMCRYLEALELLKKGTYESLKERGLGKLSLESNEEQEIEETKIRVAPRLAFLASEAYHKGLISEGQLCDRLQMSRVEVRSMLEDLGVDDDLQSFA